MKRLIVFVFALSCSRALAAPPPLLTYSGYLSSTAGAPITQPTTLIFSFYPNATGGTAVWQDSVTVAPTSDGYFSAVIGASGSNPLLPSDFAGPLYMGIQVSTESAEMSPRIALTSSPYALTADWADLTGKPSTFPPSAHQHPGSDITSAVAQADAVPWTGITGMPAGFADGTDDGIVAVLHDSTLVGDGAAVQLGVSLSAVQARVSGTCASGTFMTGVSATGQPLCGTDQNSGGTVTTVSATAPLTVVNGTTTPQLTLTTGPGLLVGSSALVVDYPAPGGNNGLSTQAARADHQHPVTVPIQLGRFVAASGSPAYSSGMWTLAAGSSIRGTLQIPAATSPITATLIVILGSNSGTATVRIASGISGTSFGPHNSPCDLPAAGSPFSWALASGPNQFSVSINATLSMGDGILGTCYAGGASSMGNQLGLMIENTSTSAVSIQLQDAEVVFN